MRHSRPRHQARSKFRYRSARRCLKAMAVTLATQQVPTTCCTSAQAPGAPVLGMHGKPQGRDTAGQYATLAVPYRAVPHERGIAHACPPPVPLGRPSAEPPCSFSSVRAAAVASVRASSVLSPSLACQTRSRAGTPRASSARQGGQGGSADPSPPAPPWRRVTGVGVQPVIAQPLCALAQQAYLELPEAQLVRGRGASRVAARAEAHPRRGQLPVAAQRSVRARQHQHLAERQGEYGARDARCSSAAGPARRNPCAHLTHSGRCKEVCHVLGKVLLPARASSRGLLSAH